MKVKTLINKLKKFNPEAKVVFNADESTWELQGVERVNLVEGYIEPLDNEDDIENAIELSSNKALN